MSATDTDTATRDRFDAVVIEVMQAAYRYTPHLFQLQTISRIIRMKLESEDSSSKVRSTLLIQGTGGGKTSVYQTIGIIMRGVHLIIQNTLLLSSDQLLKTYLQR